MIKYEVGQDVGALQLWQFDNPASQYRIISGSPVSSGRIDAGGKGHKTRFGIWRCTVGSFQCFEQGDELMTVLSGRCILTNHTEDTKVNLKPGDSLFVSDQSHVTWEITEELTKVFYGFKVNGY